MPAATGDMHMIEDGGAGRPRGGGRFGTARARARELSRARRHTWLVRALKVALPALALLVLAGAWAQIYISSRLGDLGFGIDAARLTEDGLTMEEPRISGTNAAGHRFEIQARRAIQDLADPRMVTFVDPHAVITMTGDGGRFDITARSGRYDTEAETVVLEGDVKAVSSLDYEAEFDNAAVDLRQGLVSSQDPVTVRLGNSTVNANAIDVVDSGDTIRFKNGVRVQFDPQSLRTNQE